MMRDIRGFLTVAAIALISLVVYLSGSHKALAQLTFPANIELAPLERLWHPSNTNHKTVRESSSGHSGYTSEGLQFYIPRTNISGTAPQALQRQYNAAVTDHMDSTVPGEYPVTEDTLGYLWPSPVHQSLSAISRYYDHSIFDHRTGADDSHSGYTDEGVRGYGFKRFGETPGETPTGTNNRNIQSDFVEIDFDLIMGGAAWNIQWNRNGGHNFIDSEGSTGRLAQTAVFRTGVWDRVWAPTEAGDMKGHGSPVFDVTAGGTSFESTALPLNWGGVNPNNCGSYRPILWGGTFHKEVSIVPESVLWPSRQHDEVCWSVEITPSEGGVGHEVGWLLAHIEQPEYPRVVVWNPPPAGSPPYHPGTFADASYNQHFSGPRALFVATNDLSAAIGILVTETDVHTHFVNGGFNGCENMSDALILAAWRNGIPLSAGSAVSQDMMVFLTTLDTSYRLALGVRLWNLVLAAGETGLCPSSPSNTP